MSGERLDVLGQPLEVGDRITWTYASCGECYWCRVSLQPSLCASIQPWGASRADTFPYLLGGLAELQYVPAGCGIVRVPDNVSSASAAASACAYRTVMHAFDRLGVVEPHETVAIQGSGPLGLFAGIVARDRGAYQVLVIGAPANRLRVAESFGADACLSIEEVQSPDDRIKWVQSRTGGRGADVVIQCATHDAMGEGLQLTRRGGRFVSVGVGGTPSITSADLLSSVTVIPTLMAEPRHWLQAMMFLESRGRSISFDDLISRSFRLEEATDAMRAMAAFELVKPVILPQE